MEKTKVYITTQRAIPLGHQGEGEVREIIFRPAAELLEENWTLMHQRQDDDEPYPVPLTVTSDSLIWTVTSGDTAQSGTGLAQLICMDAAGGVLKSMIYQTSVARSMDVAGDVPDPVEPWYNSLTEQIGKAGTVKTVNHVEPDESGNVQLDISGGGGSGTAGEDGYSPTAVVTQTDDGAVITITDKSGTTTATVTNGKDGAQGPKGDTGATGAQGPKGDTGATGAQGSKGDKGDTGATGPQGPKGDVGATGPKGDTGATGPQGPKGEKGDTGPAGADGTGVTILGSYDSESALNAAHPTGELGEAYLVNGYLYVWSTTTGRWENVGNIQGPKGDKGATGAQGPKGDTGATGPQGPKGDTGAAGAQGPKGDKGDPGATGPAGASGKDGTSITITDITMSTEDSGANTVTFSDGKTLSILNGTKGSTGATGAQGPKGDTGATGAQGPKGDPGEAGQSVGIDSVEMSSEDGGSNYVTFTDSTQLVVMNGSKGSAGPQGPQGPKGDTGAAGPAGAAGATGPAGADGKTPVKGTDYWTESDKEELVQDVLAALPTWTMGGSY